MATLASFKKLGKARKEAEREEDSLEAIAEAGWKQVRKQVRK